MAGRLPRKMSLNGFMPALVNINVGSSFSTMGAEGTMSWAFSRKKSRNVRRIVAASMGSLWWRCSHACVVVNSVKAAAGAGFRL